MAISGIIVDFCPMRDRPQGYDVCTRMRTNIHGLKKER